MTTLRSPKPLSCRSTLTRRWTSPRAAVAWLGRHRGFGDSSALERLTKIGTELKEIIQHDRDSPWAAWAQCWLANAGLLLPLDLAEEWSQPVPVPFG